MLADSLYLFLYRPTHKIFFVYKITACVTQKMLAFRVSIGWCLFGVTTSAGFFQAAVSVNLSIGLTHQSGYNYIIRYNGNLNTRRAKKRERERELAHFLTDCLHSYQSKWRDYLFRQYYLHHAQWRAPK